MLPEELPRLKRNEEVIDNQADRALLSQLRELGSVKRLDEVCRRLSDLAGLSVTGRCIKEDLETLDYDGQDGVSWQTYWDLEIFWVMEQLLVKSVSDDEVLGKLQDHISLRGSDESRLDLVSKIDEIEPGLLNELPEVRRLQLLRFILTECAADPARLGFIWRPVVRVPRDSQLPCEVEFAALQKQARRERYLVSLFNPMKYKDEASATLHSVEEAIRSLEQKESE
jgi:hypothetical protein